MDDNDNIKYAFAFLAITIVSIVVGVTVVETAKINSNRTECTTDE